MGHTGLKILLVGRCGQLAWELRRCLPLLGEVAVVGRPEIDLEDPESIRGAIRQAGPDVLVNAAAYTAVDQAEAEPVLAMTVNGTAVGVMAEEARRLNAWFITYSTDYVFDGMKASAYTESDEPHPLNAYGAGKLAGEGCVKQVGGAYLIFRTSWLYGGRGKNFLRTMMKLISERSQVRVVEDQVGSPTWSRDLAHATRRVIEQVVGERVMGREPLPEANAKSGIYNMTAGGSISWHGFAMAIAEEMRRHNLGGERLAEIVPISASEYPAAARRPCNSRLSNEKLWSAFGVALPDWRSSLAHVMREVAHGLEVNDANG